MKHFLKESHLQELLVGKFVFRSDMPVSIHSVFGDEMWYFRDQNKVRLNSVPDSRLMIPWLTYSTDSENDTQDHTSSFLPPGIIQELKILAFLYLHLPSIFAKNLRQSLKPQTVAVTVRVLVSFFSEIYKVHLLSGINSSSHFSHIRSISDISLQDVKLALQSHNRSDGKLLQKGLRNLSNPTLQKYFNHPVAWNAHDIDTLDFRYNKKRTDYNPVMPNELFRLLSNNSSSHVSSFLRFLGHEPEDKSNYEMCEDSLLGSTNGRQMFEDYVAIRLRDRDGRAKTGKKRNYTGNLRKRFKKNHGIPVKDFFNYLYLIQRAAYTVIGLYTGARYSDMISFTTGCVKKIHGCHVIVGTETKHHSLNESEDQDLWPAIPIMRDAIRCLEEISRITFNPYLISPSETFIIGAIATPLSLGGFTGGINSYLVAIDESKRWAHWHMNAHQLRHTLAFQLARADVGLVFISHALKHLYTALNSIPPNHTLMYGNIGEMTQQRAMQIGTAYVEAANELYDPDRPVAGAGASEFIKRRKTYFEGMAAKGWAKDEIIENLAHHGIPFASVGIGYCGGKRERLLKDGTKEIPPCLGSLQCSPATCKQAIITKCHEPMWQKILDQNIELSNDPRMAYAKDSFLTMADTARTVLRELNDDAGKE